MKPDGGADDTHIQLLREAIRVASEYFSDQSGIAKLIDRLPTIGNLTGDSQKRALFQLYFDLERAFANLGLQKKHKSNLASLVSAKLNGHYPVTMLRNSFIGLSREERILMLLTQFIEEIVQVIMNDFGTEVGHTNVDPIVESAELKDMMNITPESINFGPCREMIPKMSRSEHRLMQRQLEEFLSRLITTSEKITGHLQEVETAYYSMKNRFGWLPEFQDIARKLPSEVLDTELSLMDKRELEELVWQRTHELEQQRATLEKTVEQRTLQLQEANAELEKKVKERTSELEEKIEELERFNKVAVGREQRMIELKEKMEVLEKKMDEDK